jgi:hypothetical protein
VVSELAEHPEVVAEVEARAQPGNSTAWRRPAVVLLGAMGDRQVVEWWDAETIHVMRIDLVNALAMLPVDDEDAQTALEEALQHKARVSGGAGRAFAARGEEGYAVLRRALPTAPTACAYVLRGVAEVADRHPVLARQLAAQAGRVRATEIYASAREIDRALHFEQARRAAAGVRSLTAARARRARPGAGRRAGA